MSNKWIVVTTINPPTEAIRKISNLASSGWSAVVVGDLKTPRDWQADNIVYLPVSEQEALFPALSGVLPKNHYCRKNVGYLYALSQGADCILETDDDNIPYDSFGREIGETLEAETVGGNDWINVYAYFSSERIWPRGLPLDEAWKTGKVTHCGKGTFPIQQYLADADPDVDAIYRLILNNEVIFRQRKPVALEKGCWSPFNSQNTLFFAEAFPLLYLPCHVSFRMTDIWRSFVAQQALWVFDRRVAFRSATVKQIRNEHDFMKDFADEVPGYLDNKKIARTLAQRAQTLTPEMGMERVARELWLSLNEIGIVPDKEMTIIEEWFGALRNTETNWDRGDLSRRAL